jgi:scyllo-inositol 2-dehydrogenase (NADP+)
VERLRVGIVGYGLAGSTFHAPLIAATPGLSVASVVTGNPGRQEQVRRDHPDAEVLPRASELWERASDHDLVVVAAANSAHASLARSAIDVGLPVVVDKPIATSAKEAAALVEHARSNNILLTVFQNRRWDSDHRTLRRLIADGTLGQVTRYESRFERWRPELRDSAWRETSGPSEGGGVLLDLGSHLIDQALTLFGPVAELYSEIDSRRGAAGDDDAFLALRHSDGVLSHLWMSAFAAAPGPRLRVLGTRAGYVVDHVDGQEDALRSGRRPDDPTSWGVEPGSHWGRLVRGEASEIVPSERGEWPVFYAELERALRESGPPPVDPAGAIATLEVIETARVATPRSG